MESPFVFHTQMEMKRWSEMPILTVSARKRIKKKKKESNRDRCDDTLSACFITPSKTFTTSSK
ncbi:hypothetical protein BpHYR1_038838 [Brachionus plicatilis]|uniref:Uncharacterized protein n=1 Tax=Brachionus plicatilis TaxID=10195 RepID=A0A3M7SAX9_BRAPC|nr:hypothetical protein BpHYR1_038838 [Brachionus plicatilis]